MKALMVFLVQTIVLFSLFKMTIHLVIPSPIRRLIKTAIYKGASMVVNLAVAIHNDFEEDDEEDNVIDLEKIKKRKAK